MVLAGVKKVCRGTCELGKIVSVSFITIAAGGGVEHSGSEPGEGNALQLAADDQFLY